MGASVSLVDRAQYTCLHLACGRGHVEVVSHLLSSGGAVLTSARDAQSLTPLLLAARNGHYEVVRILLEYFAQFNSTENQLQIQNSEGCFIYSCV